MNDKGLYIFYLIFWICGRVYILAPTYYDVKIFHSIGLHFDILCLITYIIHISKETRWFWVPFYVYELIGASTFLKVQLSTNNELNAIMWTDGVKGSAVSKISANLGIIQDLFVPVFIVIVITIFYGYYVGKSNG